MERTLKPEKKGRSSPSLLMKWVGSGQVMAMEITEHRHHHRQIPIRAIAVANFADTSP